LLNFLESEKAGTNQRQQNETDPGWGNQGKAGERDAQILKMETSKRI